MTQPSRPWLLPLLAHLMLLISLPFWLLALVFSPLLLAGFEPAPPLSAYLTLAVFWLLPTLILVLLVLLWYALYQGYALRANRLSIILLALQSGALLWLLLAH